MRQNSGFNTKALNFLPQQSVNFFHPRRMLSTVNRKCDTFSSRFYKQLIHLGFTDNLGAINGKPTNPGDVNFKAKSSVYYPSPDIHKPSASKLQKPSDRPVFILPGQIYNLSAGKHAGGLEVGEPSSRSRYNGLCSVCSTWAHFTLQHTAESIWAPY